METTITKLQIEIHKIAIEHGFYSNDTTLKSLLVTATSNPNTHKLLDLTFILKRLLLIHSEISEAMEALRKDKQLLFHEELADATIRIFDLAEFCNFSLYDAIIAKIEKNKKRPYMHNKIF